MRLLRALIALAALLPVAAWGQVINLNPQTFASTVTFADGGTWSSSGISTPSQITSTLATGTAPFVVASTTVVANLNASLLLGSTWASPAAIGTGTPAAITGTTIAANTSVTAPLWTTASAPPVITSGAAAQGFYFNSGGTSFMQASGQTNVGLTLASSGNLPVIIATGGNATGTGSATTALTLDSAQKATFAGAVTISSPAVIMNGLAADTATADSTVCLKTADGTLLKGSGTIGICLGTSSARYKTDWQTFSADALGAVMHLDPGTFLYKPGHGDDGRKLQYGFLAEDVVNVMPGLVELDDQQRPNSVDILGMVPWLVRAVQQQQNQIADLHTQLANDNRPMRKASAN